MTAVAFTGTVIVDGDTYVHVAAGQWILSHTQFIHTDSFSYTFRGTKWDAPEWLSEVLMAVAYRLASWSGVSAIYVAACGLTSFVLARRLLKQLDPLPAVILLWLAIACLAAGMSTRPNVLAFPLLALWTDGLVTAREKDEAPSLWLLPLMSLWSNLHASFLFGLVLIVPLAADAFFEEESHRWVSLRAWSLFALGAFLASLINPNGLFGLIDPIRFMLRPVLASIGDWGSSIFARIGPFEVALLLLIFFLVIRPTRIPLIRLVFILLIIHMALSQRRHVSIFAIVVPMLLAEPFALALHREVAPIRGRRLPGSFAGAVATIAAIAILAVRIALPNAQPEDALSPRTALAHVPAKIAALPVLNEDVVGGFLIWHHIPTFIDTRVEVFDDKFQDNYRKLWEPDRGAILKTIQRYHIAWTIFAPKGPVNDVFDTLPGWRVLYADKNAVIHVRTDLLPR